MRFGNFDLDDAAGELRRDGELVKLTPRQFSLLRILAVNAGRVVPREEIQREIWGADTFVDFQRNLNVCVSQLRVALGDDRLIETVPRRGYRFLVAPAAPAKRWRVAIAGVVIIACCVLAGYIALRPSPSRPTLVVRPFENLDPLTDAASFLNGLNSELIGTLGIQGAQYDVIGRDSSARYQGSDYVIQGTIRHEQAKVRVTASMVRMKDQVQVWTETFERSDGVTFDLQEEIAARVSAGVLRTLFGATSSVTPPARGVSDAPYQAYLTGRMLQQKGDLTRSVPLLSEAAQAAPQFAAAHAALAESYMALGRSGIGPSESFDQATNAATTALHLDSTNAEAHNALANALFWHDWKWDAAGKEFQAAIVANPSFATAYHDEAFLLVATGRREAGLTALRRALALEPLSVRVNMDAGWLLLQARHFDEAIHQAQRAKELQPALREADACIARARIYKGESAPGVADFTDPFLRAAFAALRGDKDQALQSLESAYAARDVMMVFLNTEPAFDRLRNEARFRTLQTKMRLP